MIKSKTFAAAILNILLHVGCTIIIITVQLATVISSFLARLELPLIISLPTKRTAPVFL